MWKWLLLIPTIFCVVGTICSFIKLETWWVRAFDFPRIQMVVLIIVSALLLLILDAEYARLRYVLWAILTAATCMHAWVIFPYFSFAPKDVKDAEGVTDQTPVLSVLVANVFMENRNTQKCKDLIARENPDIVFLVETDTYWENEMKHLEKEYPYFLHKPIDNTYGLLFYSRHKPIELDLNYWIQDDIPSIFARYALNETDTVDFYGLHPRPPAPQEAKSTVPRDAELVLVGKKIEENKQPTIVAGDFNDVAWSHTSRLFRRIGHLLDPRIGRGMYNTFHADYSLLRWPLDHVFHTKEFQVMEIKRLEHIDSDHFPIFIKVAYLPQRKHEQDVEKADHQDKKEAKEKLEKALDDSTANAINPADTL